MPGRWAAPPAPAMMAFSPRAGGALGIGEHLVGHAVGRDDPRLVGDAEFLENLRLRAAGVSQSLLEPITTPTCECAGLHSMLPKVEF